MSRGPMGFVRSASPGRGLAAGRLKKGSARPFPQNAIFGTRNIFPEIPGGRVRSEICVPEIPGSVTDNSRKFREMSRRFPGNVPENFLEITTETTTRTLR